MRQSILSFACCRIKKKSPEASVTPSMNLGSSKENIIQEDQHAIITTCEIPVEEIPKVANPTKVYADKEGFMVAQIKREIKLNPKLVQVFDKNEADITYIDGDPSHFSETYIKVPKITELWENIKPGSFGSFSPYAPKIDTKKRTAIMFAFAEH